MGSRMIVFQNDDRAYFAWLREHPTGYVLNVRKKPDPDYVILHQASCRSITRELQKPGGYTGRGYQKIVATTVAALRFAAVRQGRPDGTFSHTCSLCHPPGTTRRI